MEQPPPADELVIDLLSSRDGQLTEVFLRDGRLYRVFNIAWGYDMGDEYAHVTSNISPSVEGEPVDLFRTSEIAIIRDPPETVLYERPGSD